MEITRDSSIEKFLFDEIRKNMNKERTGIHLSDLLAPRKAFWQKTKPLPPTDDEIMYWTTGKGHEDAFHLVSDIEHGTEQEWNGIKYTPDFFHNFPAEMKTRRRNIAKGGNEAEDYDYYLKQLRGYCAVTGKTQGWLHIWCLVSKDGETGATKPELASYRVGFTEDELSNERFKLDSMKCDLLVAIGTKEHTLLPQCPEWMCGKNKSEMIKNPFCTTCDREFSTDWGIEKHINSKKGQGHEIKKAEYKWEYEKRCKWFDDCKPVLPTGKG